MDSRGNTHRTGIVVASLALSACGGGGGAINSTPPPPTFAYTKIADTTGTRNFDSASTSLLPLGGPPATTPTRKFGEGVKITYDATAGTYALQIDGTSQTFGPSDLDPASTPQMRRYRAALDNALLTIVTPNPGGVDLSYTRIASWAKVGLGQVNQRLAVFGAPTQAGDMPRTGSANYSRIAVDGVLHSSSGGISTLETSTGSFTANFASGSIQTELNLKGTSTPMVGPLGGGTPISLSSIGTIASGTSGTIAPGGSGFDGSFANTSPAGGVSGSFTGSFFGPQAAEFGYVFQLTGATSELGFISSYGTVTGAK